MRECILNTQNNVKYRKKSHCFQLLQLFSAEQTSSYYVLFVKLNTQVYRRDNVHPSVYILFLTLMNRYKLGPVFDAGGSLN